MLSEVTLIRRLCLLALLSLWALSPLPVAAQQLDTETLRIVPAPGSQTDAAKNYFVIESRFGRTVRQGLQITNSAREPVSLRISTVDATTAGKGGVAFELPEEPVDDEGSWINLVRERVTVGRGETVEIPFSIEIPDETEPGVHLAGLAVQPAGGSQPEASPTSGGAVIDVQSRFVVAVQMNLPGSSVPELVIRGVEPVIGTAGVTLEVVVENVGFGLTEGEGSLELPDDGFEEGLPFGNVVPGTTLRYPITWESDPAEGEYAARVDLNYSEGDPELLTGKASWQGTFVIGEAAVGELDRLQGSEGFNWLLAVVPALVLLLLVAFLVWRRKRRPKPAPSAPQPAPQPTTPSPGPGYTGGYTGSAGGTFGSGSRPPQKTAPQPARQRPTGAPPPPPPPPPKQGT